MDVLLRLLEMLAVLLVGTGLRGVGLLNASRNAFATTVASLYAIIGLVG